MKMKLGKPFNEHRKEFVKMLSKFTVVAGRSHEIDQQRKAHDQVDARGRP